MRGSPAHAGRSAMLAFAVGALLGVAPLTRSVGADAVVDPLAELGYSETIGAAPGYVEDRACAGCHADLARSYREVAMSKAFYRPGSQPVIERFEPFFHRASGTYYEMSLVDGEYRFRSHQLDDGGRPINVYQGKVDWILGSGNHSRTYLLHLPGGELVQLPIAWYTQPSVWGMAPGFDKPRHSGLQRRVHRECMFCHNAYPEVPVDSDLPWKPDTFPTELPEGLGCQRCHGPGAEHVRAATTGDLENGTRIVDLAQLAPERRNDVCYECHMQPTVAFLPLRRFDRGIYSFRPGQDLVAYEALFDVREEGNDDRFEINHHPYRLEQSRCFLESEGELSCLTCHDPHVKVPKERRTEHYRAKCLGCHELERSVAHAEPASADCVSCHMPERRTEDVVLVTMTDHRIRVQSAEEDLLRPLAERPAPIITDAFPLYPEREADAAEIEMYRTATAAHYYRGPESALRLLTKHLEEPAVELVQPWLVLAAAQLTQGDLEGVDRTLAQIRRLAPDQPLALEFRGVRAGLGGDVDAAVEWLRKAVRANPTRPEGYHNLGLYLDGQGDKRAAKEAFERAIELRPVLASSWFHLGRMLRVLDQREDAADALKRCLAIDPGHSRAYVELAEVLVEAGDTTEGARYLRHGARVARDPVLVLRALESGGESRP